MAPRIGTALSLNQVPPEYKGLPLLGRGATSIVYQQGVKAITLTRDSLKMSWAQEYLDCTVIDDYITTGGKFSDYPVFVLEGPIFEPLTKEQRRDIRSLSKTMVKIIVGILKNHSAENHEERTHRLFDALEKGYLRDKDANLKDEVLKIIQFSRDYDAIHVDFSQTANWMNYKGNAVCIDPALDSNLREIFYEKFQKQEKCSPYVKDRTPPKSGLDLSP